MTVDPNLTLQAAIDRMCTLCDSHRDGMLFGYFTYNGFPWQCDEPSRINILGTILFALTDNGNLPAGFVFRDMNNQNHQVTGQQMIMMGYKMMSFLSAVYSAGWEHKSQIKALKDPIAVQEYDYLSTLWPNPDA